MAITIADIAKEAGVSISTVSRVMNGTKVSPKLKEKVYKIIEKIIIRRMHWHKV
ncbi:MAG: LacI family DNA-binding transcriptional regulator [Coprococcus phoceensis]